MHRKRCSSLVIAAWTSVSALIRHSFGVGSVLKTVSCVQRSSAKLMACSCEMRLSKQRNWLSKCGARSNRAPFLGSRCLTDHRPRFAATWGVGSSVLSSLTRNHDSRTAAHRGRLLGTYLNVINHNAIDRGARETHKSHTIRVSFSSTPMHRYPAVAHIPSTVSLSRVKL